MSNSVEKAIIRLLTKQRFYGNFLLNAKRIYTNKVPTCGVSITDQVNLYINEEFFNSMSEIQQEETLMHEAEHIMHLHPIRAKNLGIDNNKGAYHFNIATDAVINENKESLHKDGVTIEKLKKEIKDLEYNKASEYYYYKIKKELQQREKEGKGNSEGSLGDTIDDHGIWEESTECEELAKEMVKGNIKKAAEQSGGIGNCPHEVSILLDSLYKNSVNWKQQIRRFKARVSNRVNESTRKKRNRRYGVMYPGKMKKPKIKLAIGLDESGSVGSQEWSQFYGEIYAMQKSDPNMELVIITCDTEVGDVFTFDAKREIKRGKMGGTNYQPVLDKAAELEVDGLIFFNDAGNFDEITKPNYPVLWATVGYGTMLGNRCDFGKEIKVEVKEE